MSRNQHGARVIAQLGCALLMVVSLVGLAPAAHAAGAGSVTIIKSLGEGDTPRGPLAGIRFQFNRVDDIAPQPTPDLGAIAQSDTALMRDGSGHPLGPDVVVETDAQGRATAAGLADGVYLVRELPSRVGDVAYSVVAPFLVALPTGEGGGQDRTIEVRAKNLPLTVTLEASPDAVAPGGEIRLDARGSVPAPDRNGQLHRYALALRADRRVRDARVASVTVENGRGVTTLQEGQDYTVRYDPASGTLLMELTPSGLALLAAQRAGNPDTVVRVTATGTVADSLDAGEQLEFAVGLFTDGWPVPADLSTAELRAAAADEATIRVVAAGSAPAPQPGPPASPTTTLPLPSPTDIASAPAQWPRPGLPWTGGADATSAPRAWLPLVVVGLVLALRRSPRRTEAGAHDSRAMGQAAPSGQEEL